MSPISIEIQSWIKIAKECLTSTSCNIGMLRKLARTHLTALPHHHLHSTKHTKNWKRALTLKFLPHHFCEISFCFMIPRELNGRPGDDSVNTPVYSKWIVNYAIWGVSFNETALQWTCRMFTFIRELPRYFRIGTSASDPGVKSGNSASSSSLNIRGTPE